MDFVFPTSMSREQAEARLAGEFYHYHTFQFSNGVRITGDWDISPHVHLYRFPDLRGKRVLDIGPASGWFSFWFEQMGAEVTVVETHGYGDFDVYGVHTYTGHGGRPPDRINPDGQEIWFAPCSASFWAAHDIIGSRVKVVNGRIYQVSPELLGQQFDFVFIGALLLHLRDPIGALRAARSVLKDDGLLIATTPTWEEHDDNPHPIQQMPYTMLDKISWWQPNKACYGHWFGAAGFGEADIEEVFDYEPDRPIYHPELGVRMNHPVRLRLAHARP